MLCRIVQNLLVVGEQLIVLFVHYSTILYYIVYTNSLTQNQILRM